MFDDPRTYLWLIPFLPLLASSLTALAGPRWLGQHSHWPCLITAGGSCALSLVLFAATASGFAGIGPSAEVDRATGMRFLRADYYTWFEAGNVKVEFPLRADSLTSIMLVAVTFVGTLIAVYSVGYMRGDPGYAR